MSDNRTPLLQLTDLRTSFGHGDHEVKAVDGVSYAVEKGKTHALVGESGSGKSVSALSILKLLPYPKAWHGSGSVIFDGEDLLQRKERQLRAIRGNRIAMIFQEPLSSLNPLHSASKSRSHEVLLRAHKGFSCAATHAPATAWLSCSSLSAMSDAEKRSLRLHALPHELSGGQQPARHDRHGPGQRARSC